MIRPALAWRISIVGDTLVPSRPRHEPAEGVCRPPVGEPGATRRDVAAVQRRRALLE
jgi:hypothetical protein